MVKDTKVNVKLAIILVMNAMENLKIIVFNVNKEDYLVIRSIYIWANATNNALLVNDL